MSQIIIENIPDKECRISNSDATGHLEKLKDERKKFLGGNSGAYMFFSFSPDTLIDIGKKILVENGLSVARVILEKLDKPGDIYFDHVLVVEDFAPNLVDELSKYKESGVVYKGWKSAKDRKFGNVSKAFLSRLSPEQRKKYLKQSKLNTSSSP